MRNWARLTVTELPTFPPPVEGEGKGGGDDLETGMIAHAVKNAIQASRKRTARHCIGSESSKEQTQCHGGMRVTPHGRPEAARGVQPGLRGFDGETPNCAGLCGGRTSQTTLLMFCYNGAAMEAYVLKRGPDSPAEP